MKTKMTKSVKKIFLEDLPVMEKLEADKTLCQVLGGRGDTIAETPGVIGDLPPWCHHGGCEPSYIAMADPCYKHPTGACVND